MKEQIFKMVTPVARKEHICSVCGKPIAKGEQYFNLTVKADGKLVSKKTHYNCHYEVEKPVKSVETPVITTEQEFKQHVKNEVQAMVEAFSFQENMEIVFVPLIITECAWHFALTAVDGAARNKIPQTVKLSRTVRQLRNDYIKELSIDLDRSHRDKFMSETKRFISNNQSDFSIMWFTVNQALKSNWYELPHLDVRTNAFCAMIMVDMLIEHNKRMDKLIEDRIGNYGDTTNPKSIILRECMDAYVSPAKIDTSGHVKTCMAIFKKNLKRLEFNLEMP